MNKTTRNVVATIIKVYSVINFIVCLVLAGHFHNEYWRYVSNITIVIFVGIAILANFGIFALGEIIQLLHEIRENTRNAFLGAAEKVNSIEDELPDI